MSGDIQNSAEALTLQKLSWRIRFAIALVGSIGTLALIISGHSTNLGAVPRSLLIVLNVGTGVVSLLFQLWVVVLIAEKALNSARPGAKGKWLTLPMILAVVGVLALVPVSDWVLFRLGASLPVNYAGPVVYYGRLLVLILCVLVIVASFAWMPTKIVSGGVDGLVSAKKSLTWKQLGAILLCIVATVLFMTSPLPWQLKVGAFAAFLIYSVYAASRTRR
jgi:hypothetical protein